MKFDVETVKREFDLKKFGQKGWVANKNMQCPWCGREGKLGFLFTKQSGIVNCFFCEEGKTSFYSFLKKVDRLDLWTSTPQVSISEPLVSIQSLMDEKILVEKNDNLVEAKMPFGAKYITSDSYLDNRKFLKHHYSLFEPSFTDSFLEKGLKGYIVFKIKQNGKLVSWLARSKKSYEWHKENLKKSKLNLEPLQLRYRNSDDSYFDRMLGGYDDITDKTNTVIIVEGLFDKVSIDTELNLYSSKEIRCCFTFGNKVSENQISLLKEKKSVKRVILFYDLDSIKQSKSYSLLLSRHFETFVTNPLDNKDAGDMNADQLIACLKRRKGAIEYFATTLDTIAI